MGTREGSHVICIARLLVLSSGADIGAACADYRIRNPSPHHTSHSRIHSTRIWNGCSKTCCAFW